MCKLVNLRVNCVARYNMLRRAPLSRDNMGIDAKFMRAERFMK